MNAPLRSTRTPAALLALILLGMGLECVLLVEDRIALPDGLAGPGVQRLVHAATGPLESILGPFQEDALGTGYNHQIAQLLTVQAIAFALYLAALAVVLVWADRDDRAVLAASLAFAALFRLTLLPAPPILEGDLYRHVWDGAQIAHGLNPYRFAPREVTQGQDPAIRARLSPADREALAAAVELSRERPSMQSVIARIEYPEIRTIYPPFMQLVIGLTALAAPGSVLAVKVVGVVLDGAIVLMILAFLRLTGRRQHLVLVYAWSPLILKEYANTVHFDMLATLMALMAVWCVLGGRQALAGVALGLAVLSKIYPIVLAVALARRLGWRGLAACALTVGLGFAPFFAGGAAHPLEALSTFAGHWESHSSLYALVDGGLEALGVAGILDRPVAPGVDVLAHPPPRGVLSRLVVGALLALALLWIARWPQETPDDVLAAAFGAVGALLVLTPVCDPWYLGWAMPYVAVFPSAAWLVWSATINLYYLYFWRVPAVGAALSTAGATAGDALGAARAAAASAEGYKSWVRLIEFVPFYVLALIELGRAAWTKRFPSPPREPPAAGHTGRTSPDRRQDTS